MQSLRLRLRVRELQASKGAALHRGHQRRSAGGWCRVAGKSRAQQARAELRLSVLPLGISMKHRAFLYNGSYDA